MKQKKKEIPADVYHIKIQGELLTVFKEHKKSVDRSANYILTRALEEYLRKKQLSK